ncbi:MAG: HAMP domain-containing histidine kinase, partial [Eubacterium sp.]|nr:HAMP domain-containing histidine kinase [Eubacterium sp.]
ISPVIYADRKRINQIVENLINNSRKYAKTNVTVSLTQTDDMVSIHFRDKGPGIPDEDMPFITDKFYRGKNTGTENGSGLGLYIVKYIAERSGGSIELINHTSGEKGLEAVVHLPFKK